MRLFRFMLALLGCSLASLLSAQDPVAQSPYTLHVYEDLVQVPTLVLNSRNTNYPGLTAQHFNIRLDGGPLFHPRHVRLEGEDPINLTLLFDVSLASPLPLEQRLQSALAQLPGDWLDARDHITVYAVDCALIRSVDDAPFSLPVLQDGVARALRASDLHRRSTASASCGASLRLWDTLATIAVHVQDRPGRRVLLAVTDGEDHGSHTSWRDLQRYAGHYSVTILALRTQKNLEFEASSRDRPVKFQAVQEDGLGILCGGSGGVVLPTSYQALSGQLDAVPALLRNRYILQFARPASGAGGMHELDVKVADSSALVYTTGITFPIPDKALLSAPGTIQSDPSRAPQLGDRKILTQPQ